MFDKDLITSPRPGESGLSAQPHPGVERESFYAASDVLIDTAPAHRWELEQAERHGNVENAIKSSYLGIMWSGAAFGVSLVLVPSILSIILVLVTLNFGGIHDGVKAFISTIVVAAMAGLFGFFLAMLSGGFSITLLLVLNVMLEGLLSRRLGVVLAGAMAGFLPIGLLAILNSEHPYFGLLPKGENWLFVGFFLLFAFAAMVFGQIGALWGANSTGVWKHLKQELEFKRSLQVQSVDRCAGLSGASGRAHAPFQFRIQHLMIGMIVCSCVLALDQFSTHHSLLVTLMLYLVLQSMLLLGDWLYFRWYRNNLLER